MEKEQIVEISKYKVSDIKSDVNKRKSLLEAYKNIYKEELNLGCENCIFDGLFRIRYYVKNDFKVVEHNVTNLVVEKNAKSKSKFILPDKRVLWIPAKAAHYTNANMTDDVAIDMLRSNKKNIAHFSSFPDNWESMVNNGIYHIQDVKDIEDTIADNNVADKKEEIRETVASIFNKYTKAQILKKLKNHHPRGLNKMDLAALYIKELYPENNESK